MVFKLLHQYALHIVDLSASASKIAASRWFSNCCINMLFILLHRHDHQCWADISASRWSSKCCINMIIRLLHQLFKMLHQDGLEIADLSASAAIWSSNCCIKMVFKLLIVCPLLHQRSHQDGLQIAASKGGQM